MSIFAKGRTTRRTLVAGAAGLAVTGRAAAQPAGLTIATVAEASSLDPHFHEHDPSINVHRHVYEFLVGQDERMNLTPELATSWRATDDLTWVFELRRGVVWHDGSLFTARDVIASFRRIPTVPNSPSSFAPYVRQIAGIEAADDHTLVIRTAAPFPLMPNYMGAVMIVPEAVAASATTADFNGLRAAIGTGPYRVASYARGQAIVLEANPRHWAGPPAFPKVSFRPIPANAARVAALLAGEVDLIESPPPPDLPRLRASPANRVWACPGSRVVFYAFDFHRAQANGVTGPDGAAIPNPFLDRRVREAMSLAINRPAIAERVMEGMATPANQFVGPGAFGHAPRIPDPAFDPDRARALLAEAGLPNGFRMSIQGTNDRLLYDEKVIQALAQMFARIGIQARVEPMPSSMFFTRAGQLEFSFFFNSWGAGTSGGMDHAPHLLGTHDPARNSGSTNRGRYSNPELDRRIQAAFATIDPAPREALLREATEIAMADHAVLPIQYMTNVWASRAGLEYLPRTDGFTLATSTRRAA